MRVSVDLVVEVDDTKWARHQCVPDDGESFRSDMREYVLNAVQQSPAMEATKAKVWLRVR